MADVISYSLTRDGNKALAVHFKVREFRCKDGSDTILVSSKLVQILENVRTHFGKAVTINSAYRTKRYNTSVGGSSTSQHLYGTAADIVVADTDPLAVALYIETLMPTTGGIGLYKKTSNFVHVDVRTNKKRWVTTVGTSHYTYISKILPTIQQSSRGEVTKVLQLELGIVADGIFGAGTKQKVIDFQNKNNLTKDGIVGKNTWKKLAE